MPERRPGAGYGKVVGRILSLGFPLPGVHVDNYSFLSAPLFFDYDALVVDPHALSQLIEGVLDGSVEAATFADARIRNEPESAGDLALGALMLGRRDETKALLERGGVIVCFAHPATAHRGIAGVESIDDYCWLPQEFALSSLIRGEGSRAYVVDYQHSLAAFVESQLANIAYRAYFDTGAMYGSAVFVRSQGGAAIGVDCPVGGGRIVFLPALAASPSGDARYAMSEALQAGIRRMLGVIAEGRPPHWLEKRPLPGLDERAAALAEAQRAFDAAQDAHVSAEQAHDELVRYQRLLWQEGSVGLDDVVIDALRLIGFDVYANDRQSLELRSDGGPVLFEVEGSEYEVDMAAHHRLRQRIERAIERRGEAPRGILFVNGLRLEDPALRGAGVTRAVEIASFALRYCIAPTTTLYEAVAAKLGGDDEAVAAYRQRLVETDGVLAE